MDKNKKQFVTDADGKITGVLLPIEQYHDLLEDLNDYKVAAQFLQQKIDGTLETVTLREVKEDLEIRQNQSVVIARRHDEAISSFLAQYPSKIRQFC